MKISSVLSFAAVLLTEASIIFFSEPEVNEIAPMVQVARPEHQHAVLAEGESVQTVNEVIVVGQAPRVAKKIEKSWVCSDWKDSLAGGQYKDCGWK